MSALKFAFPNHDWMKFGQNFLSKFKLERAMPTTQIAPGDDMVEVFHVMMRINSILIDLNQDIWRYISDGWFVQKGKKGFVGSSTMPQKIKQALFSDWSILGEAAQVAHFA